jgi:hypothetical protein
MVPIVMAKNALLNFISFPPRDKSRAAGAAIFGVPLDGLRLTIRP